MSDQFNENLVEVARAFNTADFTIFRPLLALDFVYTNQKNGILVKGKLPFLNYIQDVFEVMKFDTLVFAELGYVTNNNTANKEEMSCVTFGEGSKEHKSTLIIIQEKEGKISQMNLYIIKDPQWINLKRTDVYPGYVENIHVRYMHFTIRANRLTYLSLCRYANLELGYVREVPLDWPSLRNWYMRYTGVFDYVYDELVDHPEVMTFKKNHPVVYSEIMRKNYDLIDTFFIDVDDYIDFLEKKSLRTIANEEGTCFAELKKEDDCFLYTLTWTEDGKYVGDYVKPFTPTPGDVELFNSGCKLIADRLVIYLETEKLHNVPSYPPAFGKLTFAK